MKNNKNNWWQKIKLYFSQNKTEMIILFLLVIIGVGLRFYNISDGLMFQADQARDAIVVSRMFRDLDPVFIGPVTSVGNMYLGPLYYYMMFLPLLISYPNPLGPAIMIAMLSLITIVLIYELGRKIVGKWGALIAAAMLTFSQINIEYSRFSWNPNPASFFMILLLYFLYLGWRQRKDWAWIGAIVSAGALIQLHYVNLLAAAAAGIIWLWTLWEIMQQGRSKTNLLPITDDELMRSNSPKKSNLSETELAKKLLAKPSQKKILNEIKVASNPTISMERKLKKFFLMTLIGLGVLALMFSPLFLFDLKHEGKNSKSALGIFSQEKGFSAKTVEVENPFWRSLAETHGRSQHIIGDVGFAPNNSTLGKTFLVLFVLGYLVYLANGKKIKNGRVKAAAKLLLTFLIISILGISFYKHSVFNHYILFTQVVVFLSFGLITADMWQKKIWGKLFVICLGLVFFYLNINQYSYKTPSITWKEMRRVAESIYSQIGDNTPYNLILIGPSGDDNATNYRYFLTNEKNKPLTPERIGETEKLVIIDETQNPNFDWRYSDKYEIVVFKAERISQSWQPLPNGPIIHVLEKN